MSSKLNIMQCSNGPISWHNRMTCYLKVTGEREDILIKKIHIAEEEDGEIPMRKFTGTQVRLNFL